MGRNLLADADWSYHSKGHEAFTLSVKLDIRLAVVLSISLVPRYDLHLEIAPDPERGDSHFPCLTRQH